MSRCRAFSAVRYALAVQPADLVANRVTAIANPAATLASASDMGPVDAVDRSAPTELNHPGISTVVQKAHVEHIAPPMHQQVRGRVPRAESMDCRANAPSNSFDSSPSRALVGADAKRPCRVERPCDSLDNETRRGKVRGDEVLEGQRHRLPHTRYVSPKKLSCVLGRRSPGALNKRVCRSLHNVTLPGR